MSNSYNSNGGLWTKKKVLTQNPGGRARGVDFPRDSLITISARTKIMKYIAFIYVGVVEKHQN